MSVRQSLLAILDQGPCYGYQLRAEFDRRTGSTRPLNVGQIYNTLDRLERDGLVLNSGADEQGHVYWEITDAGRADVRRWLCTPVTRGTTARDDLAVKVAVAATLPGVDVGILLHAQRAASLAQLEEAAGHVVAGPAADAHELARMLVADSRVFAAEAELRWLDRVEERLAQHPRHSFALALSTERPKRGRPARDASGPTRPEAAAAASAAPGAGVGTATVG
ncbi:PadR family transcriptional regulator [Microbacterium sp. B2969]|uniref:PadR family transcriptional regulator n=1 Tax=Microbacterium alkaliflavum TaxID=3248839 RepID=A0ABW7QBB5_9MICO